jgi:hypothetical protein
VLVLTNTSFAKTTIAGAAPEEWGECSPAEWKLLTPFVNSMYIKRARSFQPKPAPPSAPTPTTDTDPTTTDPQPPPEQQSGRVILNRARIIGHGTVFRGDVEQLLDKLPRTNAAVQVYLTGPFTKREKILAVQPIQCRVQSVRTLWDHLITNNKTLAAHVQPHLDDDAMDALEQSLVHISDDSEDAAPAVSNEQQGDQGIETTSSTTPATRPGMTYIGTNLLVNDHQTSNNDVHNNDTANDVTDPTADALAAAAECGDEPAHANIQTEAQDHDDDMPDVMHDDDDERITQAETDLEAVAQRVCSKHIFDIIYMPPGTLLHATLSHTT